ESARYRQMTWLDRSGTSLGSFGPEGSYQAMSLAPDEEHVAADGHGPAGYQLFVFDPARGTRTMITSGEATGNFPVWSPDGTRMAFGSNRDGVYNIYIMPSSGAGGDETLLRNYHNKFVTDWSKDGRFLLYGDQDPMTKKSDLWVLPMAGDRTPRLYLHS